MVNHVLSRLILLRKSLCFILYLGTKAFRSEQQAAIYLANIARIILQARPMFKTFLDIYQRTNEWITLHPRFLKDLMEGQISRYVLKNYRISAHFALCIHRIKPDLVTNMRALCADARRLSNAFFFGLYV